MVPKVTEKAAFGTTIGTFFFIPLGFSYILFYLCIQVKEKEDIFLVYSQQKRNRIMAFEKEIKEYEELRKKYQASIVSKMDKEEYIRYNEVLFYGTPPY